MELSEEVSKKLRPKKKSFVVPDDEEDEDEDEEWEEDELPVIQVSDDELDNATRE